MFDNLVESQTGNQDLKNRRRYFAVSSFVVGILFTTAVVFSIYAAEYGIGPGGFELAEIISPEEMEPAPPEVEQPRPRSSAMTTNIGQTVRQIAMAHIDEAPKSAPTEVSVTANQNLSRPISGSYTIGSFDRDAAPGAGPGTGRSSMGATDVGKGLSESSSEVKPEKEVEPPPPAVKPPAPKPRTASLGVINGKAVHLPKPLYPPAAAALNLQGKVNVQVLIDETGRVISANAVGGHPVLQGPAEKAALSAKFSTTFLSNVPVRVSGVIVYNFVR